MIRWSVKWELADHAMPAEIEQMRVIHAGDPDFGDNPEPFLEVYARCKSRSFERRPQADDKVRELIASPDVASITLNRVEPWQHVMTWRAEWTHPPIAMAKGRYSSAYRNRMKVTQASIRRAQSTPIPDHPPHDSTTTMKFTTEEEEHSPTDSSTDHCSLITAHSTPPAFNFRSYQREDIARAAMHDGAIIAWDPGLGKTMALFTFFILKKARRVLIVAPAALHEQIIGEGQKFFGLEVRPLPSQTVALDYMRRGILPFPGQDSSTDHCSLITDHSPAPPDFFITAYNWLGYNQGDEWSAEDPNELIRRRRFVIAARLLACKPAEKPFAKSEKSHWKVLGIPEGSGTHAVREAWQQAARLHDPALHPADDEIAWRSARINKAYRVLTGTEAPEHDEDFAADLAEVRQSPAQKAAVIFLREIESGIGVEKSYPLEPSTIDHQLSTSHSIRCCFKPTLCSIVKTTFDGIVCDEAVRLKSGTAYQADGVLRMEARYRLALTGTPIKNKLPDLFFLASFVTGHTARATARWPYGNGTADRAQFAQDFGVWEENLTKQEEARQSDKKFIPRGKTDPTRICNVHRLWRILGPVNIRRRKDDVPGCDIVGKTVVPVRIMPGTEQQRDRCGKLRCFSGPELP